MNDYGIIIQPETSPTIEEVSKNCREDGDSIIDITDSLIDDRYIVNQPSATIVRHGFDEKHN